MRRAMVSGIVSGDAGQFYISLRNKRFRLVSEQRKTEERDFRFLAAREMKRGPKNERGEGEGRKERSLIYKGFLLHSCG